MESSHIRQLCRPGAFDHPAPDFEVRETHISWVVLCGGYAYKIKKPVDFGFLDFSTLEQRRHFCEQELRLNRRFSPELYLDVVAITKTTQGPAVGGDGPILDYAVKMLRFDENQLLDNIAARGELDRGMVRSLGRELARLHRQLPPQYPDPESSAPGTPASLNHALDENFRQIGEYPLDGVDLHQLSAIQAWTESRYRALLPLMKTRCTEGWVIDGHGDDHLGNIALIEGEVRLFDCIEFNADFRVLDSIAEIALLSMDLDARDHPAESHLLLSDYLEYRGDFAGLELLDLYRSYYAIVRAKVNLLREDRNDPALRDSDAYREMRRYIQFAHHYCSPNRTWIAITHGVSGTGKSTVAEKLVSASGAIRVRSDVERKRLFGLAPEQSSSPADESRLYSREMTQSTFDTLEQLARCIIDSGFPVIVDATFLHHPIRERFAQLAASLAVPFAIIDCVAEPEQIRQRLTQRSERGGDASEADITIMERQLEFREPLSGAELDYRVEARSSEDAAALWVRLREHLGH